MGASRRTAVLAACVLLAASVFPVAGAAATGPLCEVNGYDCESWVGRYQTASDGVGWARDLAASPAGDRVFVTGDYGPDPLSRKAVTLAYDAATGEELWATTHGDPDPSTGWAIAAGSDGSRVYVAGDSRDDDGRLQYLTVAYAAATGEELWTATYRGDRHDTLARAWGIAVSPDEETVFVTGRSPELFQADHVTIAYDAATGVERWRAVTSGPRGGAETRAIGVTPDGARVLIAGSNWGPVGSSLDYVTATYDAATGEELWVSRYDGTGNADIAFDLAVSPDGQTAFVTGRSSNESQSNQYGTVAYDTGNGTERWAARYEGPQGGGSRADAIDIDPLGERVYVTGRSLGDDTGLDYATVAYDAAMGDEVWVSRYHGPTLDGDDVARALTVSPTGRVFVTGRSTSRDRSWQNQDIATVAYDGESGEELWAARYDGPARSDDEAMAIGVAPDGDTVYAAGLSFDSSNFGLSATAQYVTLAYDADLDPEPPAPTPSPTPSPTPTEPPDPAETRYYFHSSGSPVNQIDKLQAAGATFDTSEPTGANPSFGPDISPSNVAGDDILVPTWTGTIAESINALTVDLWQKTPLHEFGREGRVTYDVHLFLGDTEFRLPTFSVPATNPLTIPRRVTHTFTTMLDDGDEETPLAIDPAGDEVTIAISGSAEPDGIAVVVYDSEDFPSGFSVAAAPEPEVTDVSFTERSSTSGQYSDETFFEARLEDSDGDPIEGETLTFELTGEESSRDFTAATDGDGIASVSPTLTEKPGPYQLTARYDGDEGRAPAADTIPFVVEKKDTATELTVQGQGQNTTLRARLSHLDSPSKRVEERTIDFYSDDELIGSEQTDEDGIAEVTVPPGHRGANRTYEAIFEGDDFYEGSSDSRPGRGGPGESDGAAEQWGRFVFLRGLLL